METVAFITVVLDVTCAIDGPVSCTVHAASMVVLDVTCAIDGPVSCTGARCIHGGA